MSAMQGIVAEVPMFSLLDPTERATLAELLETESRRKGETIFRTGDAGQCLYIVHTGMVEVSVETVEGEVLVASENGPGDVFGEISLLDGGPRTATAIAQEDCELLSLSRESVFDLFKEHPHAALDLLTSVGQRLRQTDELLRTHVARNANTEEEELLTVGQRIADRIAAFGGSWTFIILFLAVMLGWIVLNTLILTKIFDPYPFILLNLVLSMMAAMQAPVIMMSQNRQSSKDRLKSDLDYQVNLKAELEVAHLHNKIDRVYEVMQEHWASYERAMKRDARLSDGAKSPNDYY